MTSTSSIFSMFVSPVIWSCMLLGQRGLAIAMQHTMPSSVNGTEPATSSSSSSSSSPEEAYSPSVDAVSLAINLVNDYEDVTQQMCIPKYLVRVLWPLL